MLNPLSEASIDHPHKGRYFDALNLSNCSEKPIMLMGGGTYYANEGGAYYANAETQLRCHMSEHIHYINDRFYCLLLNHFESDC